MLGRAEEARADSTVGSTASELPDLATEGLIPRGHGCPRAVRLNDADEGLSTASTFFIIIHQLVADTM